MKKTLLISGICLIAYAISVKAQITVDSTDFATVGDTVIIANDTLPPVSITIGGTGLQTWDFTGLQINYFDTLTFRDVDNATSDSSFAGSNLVMETPYQTSYLDFNASSLNVLGFFGDPLNVGVGFPLNLNPTQTRMEFPSTLGSSFIDTSEFVLFLDPSALNAPFTLPAEFDSIRINHYAYVNSTIDAFGSVAVPGGTYNSIRQFYKENTIDSIWAHCSDTNGCDLIILVLPLGWSLAPVVPSITPYDANPIVDSTFTYRWLANNQDFPVVELETDTVGNVTVARFKLDIAVVAKITSVTAALCKDSCNGVAVATGISGVEPYSYMWNDPLTQTTETATGLCAGTYSVMVIDASGDTSSAAIAIVSEPTALSGGTITTTPDTNNTGDGTATVSAVTGGTTPYTYSWNTTPIQTSSNATNIAAGSYTVTVTDANGCTFSVPATVAPITGINETIDAKNGIRIYPNPTVSELNVITPLLNEGVVIIYNIIGKQLMNIELDGTTTIVNTSELVGGMYIYQVVDAEGNMMKNGKFTVSK